MRYPLTAMTLNEKHCAIRWDCINPNEFASQEEAEANGFNKWIEVTPRTFEEYSSRTLSGLQHANIAIVVVL